MKKIIFTVTNDLTYDQRMERICAALSDHGYNITLVGREKSSSKKLLKRDYNQVRIPCRFESGKLFYFEYNFKLFIYLFKQKCDALCAIDLDTALPVMAVSNIKNVKWVYDAHEYFSQMEEIVTRPLIHRLWQWVERIVMSRASHAYTISAGYAALFKERYNADFEVIRNVPRAHSHDSKQEATIGKLIYQGAVNEGRGLTESIDCANNNNWIELDIFGIGPIYDQLKKEAGERVRFKGATEPNVLRELTPQYWCGLTLFSKTGLHHRHSLANRFFDYIHAEIPQIAMNYPEYKAYNDQFEVAILINDLTHKELSNALERLKSDADLYKRLKENTALAKAEFNWQKESKRVVRFYQNLFVV